MAHHSGKEHCHVKQMFGVIKHFRSEGGVLESLFGKLLNFMSTIYFKFVLEFSFCFVFLIILVLSKFWPSFVGVLMDIRITE